MSSEGRVRTSSASLFLLLFLLPLEKPTCLMPSHLHFPTEMRKERKKLNQSLQSIDLKLYLQCGKVINISPTEESFWEPLFQQ